MKKLQKFLEAPLQLIEIKDNQDNKDINVIKKDLFYVMTSSKQSMT